MAGQRQRRKARSSIGKATRKPKNRKLNLRLPKQLADRYDRKRTVTQNMEALGLAHKLVTKRVGGIERRAVKTKPIHQEQELEIPAGFARVKRDSSGKIIDIVENEPAVPMVQTPWGAPLNVEEVDQAVSRLREEDELSAIEALQHKAPLIPEPTQRHASFAEMRLLHQLVAAHGRDIEAMSRDKRNVLHRTPAQLRQSIKRSGGWTVLEQPNA